MLTKLNYEFKERAERKATDVSESGKLELFLKNDGEKVFILYT